MGIFARLSQLRYSGLVIAFLLVLTGQLAGDEIKTLVPEIYPEKFISTQKLSFSLDVGVPYSPQMEFSEFRVEKPLRIISGPYLRSARNLEEGNWVYFTQIKLVISADSSGIFTLPRLSLYYDGIEYRMPEMILPVLEPDESDYKYPIFLNWRDFPETLYVGQSFPLILEFLNLENISLPDSIDMGNIEGGILEEASGVGRIKNEVIGDDKIYHVPAESWMLTASDQGNLRIPTVKANLDQLKRQIPAREIAVLPLPESESPIQAIGNINYDIAISSLDINKGERILVTQIFEGEGNLKFVDFPELELENGAVVRKEDSQEILPGEKGYRGKITRTSHVLFDSAGTGEIRSPRFCIFDPFDETIRYIDALAWDIEISRDASQLETTQNNEYELLEYSAIRFLRLHFTADNPLLYLLLLPGIMFFIFHGFLKKRLKGILFLMTSSLFLFMSSSTVSGTNNERFWLNSAADAWEAGQYEAAENRYLTLLDEIPYNPGVYYNLSLTADAAGNQAKSIFYIRRALLQKPGDPFLKSYFESLCRQYNQDDQIPLPVSWQRAYTFALWLIFVNLFFTGLAFVLRRKNTLLIMVFVLLTLLLVVDTGIICFEYYSLGQSMAVISPNAPPLKKVPRKEGGDWLEIQPGTSVWVIEEINDFYLLENGYGLRGWMEKDFCLVLQEGL